MKYFLYALLVHLSIFLGNVTFVQSFQREIGRGHLRPIDKNTGSILTHKNCRLYAISNDQAFSHVNHYEPITESISFTTTKQDNSNQSNPLITLDIPPKNSMVPLLLTLPVLFGFIAHQLQLQLPFKWLSICTFLAAYVPCIVWGLPKTNIGSWKSKISNMHRFGGISTILLPILLTIWEGVTGAHPHLLMYGLTVAAISCNILFGMLLIPRRIPAYDIPTNRAFAVGVLLGFSFLTLSLFFRFGHHSWYFIPGVISSVLALYTCIYAWSDALQHTILFMKGHFKPDIGKKWFLPFQRSTFKNIFVDYLTKSPTKEGLEASVSPANIVTVSTTTLTAIFAMISLLQVRYLHFGSNGVKAMGILYPDIVRWSVYEALLAVAANNFGTFAGTLVLHNKVSQRTAGIFNAIGLMIPVLNLIGFCFRHPHAIKLLMATSFNSF